MLSMLVFSSACFANEKQVNLSHDALITIDKTNSEINFGYGYYIKSMIDSVNGNGQAVFLIDFSDLGSSDEVNINFEASTEAESTISIYGNPTISVNGTVVTVNNRNVIKNYTAKGKAYIDPVVITSGNIRSQYKLGSGKQAGGSASSTRKFVVGKGTKLLIVFKNNTPSDNWIDYLFEWYENGREL